MSYRTLLRTQDLRPRTWEFLTFVVAVVLMIATGTTLRYDPEYLLPVSASGPGALVVEADFGAVPIEPGDIVTVVPASDDVKGDAERAIRGTVESVTPGAISLRLEASMDVNAGDRVIVRAPSVLVFVALAQRILR